MGKPAKILLIDIELNKRKMKCEDPHDVYRLFIMIAKSLKTDIDNLFSRYVILYLDSMGIEREIVEQLNYDQAILDTGESPLMIRVVTESESIPKPEEYNQAERSLHKARETISEMWKY